MAFFFNKSFDANGFGKLIADLPAGSVADRELRKVTLNDVAIAIKVIEDVRFTSCKWKGVNAGEIVFKNVIFEDCEFDDVNLRDAQLTNVQFIQSELRNVVMNEAVLQKVKFTNSKLVSSDANIDNSYNGIKADEVDFYGCELSGVGFYRGKGRFSFVNSNLYDVSGQSLVDGSALYFRNTKASLINFDRSRLTELQVLDSVIDKDSSLGGGTITKINVENSKLDFALGENNNMETAVFMNSGDVVVGGGKNNRNILIKDCPKNTYVISAGVVGFDKLEIENCDVVAIRFPRSSGKLVSIKNTSAYTVDFRMSNIESLVLENVTVNSELKYSGTTVNNLIKTNLTLGDDIEVSKDESNFELMPDKIIDKSN